MSNGLLLLTWLLTFALTLPTWKIDVMFKFYLHVDVYRSYWGRTSRFGKQNTLQQQINMSLSSIVLQSLTIINSL